MRGGGGGGVGGGGGDAASKGVPFAEYSDTTVVRNLQNSESDALIGSAK